MKHRLLAGSVSLAALLASFAAGAAPVAAETDCDYTFPASGGVYSDPVGPGDVICGRGGDDTVRRMQGGVFKGGGGDDTVRRLSAGRFLGGPGRDTLDGRMRGGTFKGNAGIDIVVDQRDGTFVGGSGSDLVYQLWGGTYKGGVGQDMVEQCADVPPAVVRSVEHVSSASCPGVPPQ
jgi:hypothetical protein